jgi:hypothetical protein
MGRFERLQAAIRDELVAVRRRSATRLDDLSLKRKVDTPNLEAAARRVPDYHDRMTRVAAIYLLLGYEVPRVSQPHRGLLEIMFALPEQLRSLRPKELRDKAAESIKEDPASFARTGGVADHAITALAAQIAADCVAESSSDHVDDSIEEDGADEPAETTRRVKWRHIAAGLVVVASLAVGVVLLFSKNGDSRSPSNESSTASGRPDAEQLEARYDGKDPRGIAGAASRCADPPPSRAVPASTPPVYGPDGQQVGSIELRTSPVCPVIWARVLWESDPNATYDIPEGWRLHIVAHRPETETVIDFVEPPSQGPIPYGLGPMLTTIRGCVYVEAYFTNQDRKTNAVPTSCIVADVAG